MSKLKYLNNATFALKWAVLYPIDPNNSLFKKVLYFFWCVYFVSSFVIMSIQCLVELAIEPFNLLGQNFLILNTGVYLGLFMNFGIFYQNSEAFVRLIHNINKNFWAKADNGFDEIEMEHYRVLTNKLPKYWTVTLGISATYFSLQPLFRGIRIMPVPGWFPYDVSPSPYYELSYLWQILCQINLAIIYASTDIIYPAIALIIGRQFEIVGVNIKNSFFYSLWKFGVPKDVVFDFKKKLTNDDLLQMLVFQDIFRIINTKEFHRFNVEYFKKNIRQHQMLLSYSEDLTQIMGTFLFTKVVTSFFNISFTLFCIVTSGDFSLMFGLGSYISIAYVELFIYTYGGQILTEGADFMWTLYDCPWYLCDATFKKLFLLVQMRVNKMIYTKAGNYFQMHSPMFISFCRSIFSYVALLNELIKND